MLNLLKAKVMVVVLLKTWNIAKNCAVRKSNILRILKLNRLALRILRHARPSRTNNVFYWVFFYAKICKKTNVFGEKQPFLCDFKALLLIFHNYIQNHL